MPETNDQWERFLNPEVVQAGLSSATLYITVFEMLKDSIVERLRDFYTNSWDESGPATGPEYDREVLARKRSGLYASIDWLREQDAIDDADITMFEELKRVRNTLAHKLFGVVTGQVPSDHQDRLPSLIALLQKVEVWWVVNVEIPTNPDYDGEQINEAEIVPGAVLSLQILLEVASGNKDLLEHWRKHADPEQVSSRRTKGWPA